MKNLILGSLVASTLAGTALGAFSLGDNASVYINADASVRYDDNIQQQPAGPGKVHDTIFEFSPGIELANPQAAALQSKFTYTENITNYVKNTDLNTQLALFDLTNNYTDAKNSANLNGGYHELNQNTPISGVPGLLRRNETVADGGDVYTINDKSKIGLDLNYDRTVYLAPGLENSNIYSVAPTYYYNVSPKLDATLGFRYRQTELSGAQSYQDYYYNVGMKGDFSSFVPKLQGSFSLGVDQHQGSVSQGGNDVTVGAASTFDWQPLEKTTFTLGVSNDFGASAAGQEQSTFAVNLGVQQSLIPDKLVGSAGVGYSIIKYTGTSRTDDYWSANIGLKYYLSQYWSLSVSYNYLDNGSTLVGESFGDNVYSLSAHLRF